MEAGILLGNLLGAGDGAELGSSGDNRARDDTILSALDGRVPLVGVPSSEEGNLQIKAA